MKISSVDPRDITWEVRDVVFRVYFWSSDGKASEEYELSGAKDIGEVLSWAQREQSSRDGKFVIYARVECNGENGLLLLAESCEVEG
jgi:hypothetical protein